MRWQGDDHDRLVCMGLRDRQMVRGRGVGVTIFVLSNLIEVGGDKKETCVLKEAERVGTASGRMDVGRIKGE